MAAQGIILKNASGTSQGIGPGYSPTGAIGLTLVNLPLAILVELRVMNAILNGTIPVGTDLTTARADELQNACPPGSL